jgi:hypothetical protein
VVIFGRLTPSTGFSKTALSSHSFLNSDDRAANLRRMVASPQPLPSRYVRQALTWARLTSRSWAGVETGAKARNSVIARSYVFLGWALSRLANHSTSGGISARSEIEKRRGTGISQLQRILFHDDNF